MKMIIASKNRHKINELKAILSESFFDVELYTAEEMGITDDIVEDGTTFEENALIKARAVKREGYYSVGDDSGLSVDALDGAPGIYSARFSGEHGNDKANNEKLLSLMEDKEDRSASFVCAMACVTPEGEEFAVRGEVKGQLLFECRGEGGFGYDPLFYLPEFGKAFSEMTESEKNSVSHRGRASKALSAELQKRLCR